MADERDSRSPSWTGTGCEIPIWPGIAIAIFVGSVYLAVASQGTFRFGPSKYHHHILIADAWLHGQLYVRDEVLQQRADEFRRNHRAAVERQFRDAGRQLTEEEWEGIHATEDPPMALDWARAGGRSYGYWGPMVPALLLPYVALAGIDASDTLFSCLIGAGTVLMTFLMLRRAAQAGFVPGTTQTCVALALLLGLGTVHFYLAVVGHVWFLAQIVATFFVTTAIWFVLRSGEAQRWAVAAGAAFGAAFLSRSAVLATLPFFCLAILAACGRGGAPRWHQGFRRMLGFALPLLLAGAIALAFNYARFGNVFESGAAILVMTTGNNQFRVDYANYGMFSLHYVRRNIYSYFVNPWLRRHEETGAITFDPYGNSMFLVTPALLYVFRSYRRIGVFTVGLWLGAGTSMALLLTFHGSGWYGFGNRYLLDLMPLAIMLIALGMEGRLTLEPGVLIALSIAVNAWGTYRFCMERGWY